jgi:signal transduction histidine kinase
MMKHLLTFVLVLCLVFFVTSQTTESIEDLENQVHSLELEETLGKIEDEAAEAVEEATRSTNTILETQPTTTQNNAVKKETTSSQCDPAKAKSKTTTLLLAIFLGGIGVDRFYIGDLTTVFF